VLTGAEGTFAFTDLAPGTNYVLTAQKRGYVSAAFGAGSSGTRPPFVLAAVETLLAELRLIAQGVITGTITNQAGDGLAQATVVLWQERFRLGVREKNYVRVGRTDDRGVYRMAELPAGRYFVISGETNAGSARQSEANLTTYFGGTQDIRKATIVEVKPADEVRADIKLLRGTVYSLGGQVLNASGAALTQRLVSVRRNNDPAFTTRAMALTNEEGKFQIHDLTPGDYVIDMDDRTDPQTGVVERLISDTPVVLGPADLNDFVVRPATGVAIQGSVQIEDTEWTPQAQPGRAGPALTEPLLTASTGTPFVGLALPSSPITGSYAAAVRPDATFDITGLEPGEYQFVAGGFPETYYVKSVSIGTDDVTRTPIRVPGGPLSVVVSTNGAEVSGKVSRDGLGVALWPETENPGHPLHGIRVVNSGKGGAFRMTGLAPGAYRIAVFDTTEPGVLWNYGFLSKFAIKFGETPRIDLVEGKKVMIDPPLISPARFKEEFDKLP
jgi:hypothetical protein